MSWDAQLTFENAASFDCILDTGQTLETGLEQVTQVTVSDHTKLTGRDQPDQHPMEAITGLDTALGSKLTGAGALANFEVEELLQH